MRNSKLIEELANAPAGSNINIVIHLSKAELEKAEAIANEEGLYRLELELLDVNTECTDANECVVLYV